MDSMKHRAIRSSALAVVAVCSAALPSRAQTPRPDGLLQLASGDSVELISSGPVRLATGATGLLLQYHPFVPVRGSPELKAIALQVWRWLRPRIEGNPPPFIVLSATTDRAHPASGYRRVQNFNYVVEHRADGKWYLVNDAEPLE